MGTEQPFRNADDEAGNFDAIVIGAGVAGLYALHLLRRRGLSVRVLEAAPAIGGTWYWNAYPGARCDVESLDYSYSFSPELDQEWTWTEKFASQKEILAYLNHVADRFDLRPDIQLETRVSSASFDELESRWDVETESGEHFKSQFLICALGTLSAPLKPRFEGIDEFEGEWYMTQDWPHEKLDFSGKKVAVVGTGSSGIQAIPVIAGEAADLTVFQRTANFSVPGRNRPLTEEEINARRAVYPQFREEQRWAPGGTPQDINPKSAREMPEDERRAELERRWEIGSALVINVTFGDIITNLESNEVMAEFNREKIREIVDDPEVADLLCPTDHPWATKRICVDHGYFETYNRDNVHLVSIRDNPIDRITPKGIRLEDGSEHEFDVIVFAIGYDAISGSLLRFEIRGKDGVTLREEWTNGPRSYLGLGMTHFPNLFTVTGPGSPAVLANMTTSVEQHVEWIDNCIGYMREHGYETIEPTLKAQEEWTENLMEIAKETLWLHAKSSYYVGANVPGKPYAFPLYAGGFDNYRRKCNEVSANEYEGFVLGRPPGEIEKIDSSAVGGAL